MRVTISEAKRKLAELIKAVERGEQITICRRSVPVVDLVRAKKVIPREIKLGSLKGKIKIIDPGWWKPMSDDEVEAFLDGLY